MSKILLILLFLFSATTSLAQTTPSFNATNQGISILKINNQNFGYPAEITPQTISQGQNKPQLYLLSSGWSWICENIGNILTSTPTNPLFFNSQNCKIITKMSIVGSVNPNGQPNYLNPANSVYNQSPWKMAYDGALNVNIINNNRLVALRHGENSNSTLGGFKYQNTVFPNVKVDVCSSGYVNGVYQHCGAALTSYANLGWANYNPSTGWNKEDWHDEGPVLWPPTPLLYRNLDGTRGPAGGPYHTTTFQGNDGYMYAYTISQIGTENNHDQCNVIARAPVSGNLMPGTWKYYYNGNFSSDALPTGFTKERINDFYSTPAGPATCILPNTANVAHLYFNVAKIKNTPFYIGVEESLPNRTSWRMGVRISTDLVNWSDIQVLSTAANWGSGQKFSYPIFYNKEGNSSNEIDANEFYILGNGADGASGYSLNKMKISLDITPPKQKVTLIDFSNWKTKYLAGQSTLVEFNTWKTAYLLQ